MLLPAQAVDEVALVQGRGSRHRCAARCGCDANALARTVRRSRPRAGPVGRGRPCPGPRSPIASRGRGPGRSGLREPLGHGRGTPRNRPWSPPRWGRPARGPARPGTPARRPGCGPADPHHPAGVVVGDHGQVLVSPLVGDLVHPDPVQPVQAGPVDRVRCSATSRFTAASTVSQAHRSSWRSRSCPCVSEPSDHLLEITTMTGTRPSPWHFLRPNPTTWAQAIRAISASSQNRLELISRCRQRRRDTS